jgi:hypothetical protein
MLYAIITDEGGAFTPLVAGNFALFYVKFPCAVALHLVLFPQVAKGMKIMKFANNQCDLFVENGAEIAYTIGLIQALTALLCEGINVIMLSYQHYVSHSIIHFVALEVVIELGEMYLESLMDNPLSQVLHHPVRIRHRGADIKFMDRSLFHKMARLTYKSLRGLYISIIFYYVPFSTIFI